MDQTNKKDPAVSYKFRRQDHAKLDKCAVPNGPVRDFADCAWLFHPGTARSWYTIRMGFREAAMIYRYARDGIVAEIGRCVGGSTIVLATAARRVLSVDRCPADDAALTRALKKMGIHEGVELVVADSQTYKPATASFDFIFIDGEHTLEGVSRDYKTWLPALRSGGYMAFHDMVPFKENASQGVAEFRKRVLDKDRHVKFAEEADTTRVYRKL